MRALLVVVVALGVLILAALALGPHLVDQTTTRAHLADAISTWTGQPSRVEGEATLRLLPLPSLSVNDVRIGQDADGELILSVERIDLQLPLAPLLRGQIEIRDARLIRPVLHIPAMTDDAVDDVASDVRERLGNILLRRVAVVDGEIVLDGWPRTGETRLNGIQATLQADGPNGPFQLDGEGSLAGRPWRSSLTLGLTDRPMTTMDLLLEAGPGDTRSSLAYRGVVGMPSGDLRLDGDAKLSLADVTTALGALHEFGLMSTMPPVALANAADLAGKLRIDEKALVLDQASLRGGGTDLQGGVTIGLGGQPRIDVTLTGNKLALVGTDGQFAEDGVFAGFVKRATGSVDLRIDEVTLGARALTKVVLEGSLAGDETMAVTQATGSLPGNFSAIFSGKIGLSPTDPSWLGRIGIAADDLRATLTSQGIDVSAIPEDRLRGVTLDGDLAVSRSDVTLRGTTVRLDGTRVDGSLAVADGARRKVAAILAVDRFDLDPYLPLLNDLASDRSEGGFASRYDAAFDINLGRLAFAGERIEEIRLKGGLEQERLTLEEASAGSVAEARVKVVGSADLAAREGQFAIEGSSGNPSALARLVLDQPPAWFARFAPLRLEATMHGPFTGMEVEGSLNAADLALAVRGTATPGATDPVFDLGVRLDPITLDRLARDVGIVTLAPVPGQFVVGGRLGRAGGGPLRVSFTGEAGPFDFAADLAAAFHGAIPTVTGQVGIEPADAEALAAAYSLGERLRGSTMAPLAAWPGNWPGQTLDWSWLYDVAVDIGLHRLQGAALTPASPALGHLGITDGVFRVADLDFPVANGLLSGGIEISGRDVVPRLGIDAAIAGADAGTLLAALGTDGRTTGTIDIAVQAKGGGLSVAEMVRTLAGTGRITLRNARFETVDLLETARRLGRENRAIQGFAAQGSTTVPSFDGAFTIERGVLDTDEGARAVIEGVPAKIGLRIDLPAWVLECVVLGEARTAPDSVPLALRLLGVPGRLQPLPLIGAPN